MTPKELIADSISQPNAVNQYNEHTIRFHARACHHRGRTPTMMLRQVARNHGFITEVLELALAEWETL